MSKTLAIIGAGPSGLVAAKEALKEGFEIIVFEKSEYLGGTWNPISGQVWSSMQTNISRFTTVFSENPWQDSDPLFPKSPQVFEYLCKFAKKYSIDKYIKFNTDVVSIKFEGSTNTKWKIETVDLKCEKERKIYEFEFLIIATGIFSKPYFPAFHQTKSNFNGLVLHSKFYNQNRSEMKEKKVALIGTSFSSLEISSDLVDFASSVVNVIKKPYWIIPRYLPIKNQSYKLPVDFVFNSQKSNFISKMMEKENPIDASVSRYKYFCDLCVDQNKIDSLKVVSNEQEPIKISISDSYIQNVLENKIRVKRGEITHFDSDGLCFKDGSNEAVDCVLYCTGYLASLDFFDQNIKDKLEFDENDQIQPVLLHKCTFHPDIEKIAFVGFYKGPYFGVIELQAKWAINIFSGKIPMPSYEKMKHGVDVERIIRNKKPRPQFPHSYVELANSIAEELNLMPDFKTLCEEDPNTYKLLWEGVTVPDLYKFNENNSIALNTLQKLNEKIEELKTNDQIFF